uniref:Uncharacterized protein n=1 Tax=Guillardia theta TaxID=55529 RepID=A0A7S4KZ50_GUITH|mmetsp:Transcript_34203/g.107162  ORF Transcript_34203/g.107162 Transcript_34203/m.107162 type:complete len:310 (+) Transcript_34203:270-1199(+)
MVGLGAMNIQFDAEVTCRIAFAILSLIVCVCAFIAVVRRGRAWKDRGSAYMQLLVLTFVINISQVVDALLDVYWIFNAELPEHTDWSQQCQNAVNPENSTYPGKVTLEKCWIQRVDASLNYTSLSLSLLSFVIVTFFFLRLVLRLRLQSPDQAQIEEVQQCLRVPLLISCTWVAILFGASISGDLPHAFSCQDPSWTAFLVTYTVMACILLLGVIIFGKERAKKKAGSKFWISLIKLGIVMLLSTAVGILDTLDHSLRVPRNCLPFDSTFPTLSHGENYSGIVRGIVQLIARIVLYTFPSLALLSFFHR